MLQPLLEFLFYKGNHKELVEPAFALSVDYIQKWAQYTSALLVREKGIQSGLIFVSSFIVILNVLGNIFRYISTVYLSKIRTKIIEHIRQDVFYNLMSLHVGYIENKRKGDILTRITSDVAEIEQSVVTTFEAVLRDPITIVFFLYLMIGISWQLTLFMLLMIPVAAIVISFVTKSLKRDAFGAQDQHGYIMSTTDEAISGIRVVKAFAAESFIKKLFDQFNHRYSQLTRRQWYKKALVPGFSESSGVAIVGIVLYYGGTLVYNNQMEAAAFISYIALVSQIIRPAKSFSQAFGNIYKGIASAERVFELMDAKAEIIEKPDAVSFPHFNSSIKMKNVSFQYNADVEVLKNITLEFQKGKMYGLVGKSGSGKSTLSELILRFYDPNQGEITIDGIDLKDLKIADFRGQMAVVTQEPILFNDSIYNNIAFGNPNATELEVIEAAKAANAHDFIIELINGYQTNVGDRGNLLSGGQRQRLSIARAILKNPPILILDEATSALDTQSERIVQDALFKLMKNRTSIVIAHRLSTIIDAHQIIVMDKGEIVQIGTHQELILIKDNLYANLYENQRMSN